MKNFRLEMVDNSFGWTASSYIEAHKDDLTLKDLKKWWKHVLKSIPKAAWYSNCLDVLAWYTDEDGEHEMVQYWAMEEGSHNPAIPFM